VLVAPVERSPARGDRGRDWEHVAVDAACVWGAGLLSQIESPLTGLLGAQVRRGPAFLRYRAQ
jgi:hypothetical protein